MRAGTYFTLDIYESAAVAEALRCRVDFLRKELRNRHNTAVVTQHLNHELDLVTEIQDRLKKRFAKTNKALEGMMKGQTDAW